MKPAEPILVTGAAGFVGSAVVRLLRSKGLATIAHARKAGPGIDWAADLCAPANAPLSLPRAIGSVIHCAAAIPARSSAFDADNVAAASCLAAALAGCATLRRIIHVSSVSVYARPAPGRWEIPETAETVDPQDSGAESYARSKKAAELALNTVVGDRSGIFVSHLRASSIYGRGMSRTTLLPVLVGKALRGEDMLLGGPRNYRQNFIHVDDVAALALALLGHDSPAHLMNAFSDDTLEVGALAQMIRNQLGSKSRIVDQTDASEIPTPVFVNDLAKSLHPVFRPLADNLRDAE